MNDATYITTPVIGLEIHVELATATKMFCRCRNRFGDPPNTHTCPVCIGMPGVLPVMNRKAVEYAMKVALALGCRVGDFTKWDRKSYYYPDLPKNYQISQYDLPLGVGGHVEVPLRGGRTKKIGITRAHLEEDAGKNVHDFPTHTGVDLNRAGVPQLAERGKAWSLAEVGKQNWGWRDDLGACEFQRGKEEAHDYRYFPDPDLVPVVVDDPWRERVRAAIGELPLARKQRFCAEYGLTEKEADALTQDVPTGDLLDSAAGAGAEPKRCVNLLLGRAAAIANERGCTVAEIGLSAGHLTDLARMLSAGEVSATAADKILDRMIATGRAPGEIARGEGLLAVSDAGRIAEWVAAAVAANPHAVADVRAGGKKRKKAFGFLVGQVMQMSKGAARPAEVQKLLGEALGP